MRRGRGSVLRAGSFAVATAASGVLMARVLGPPLGMPRLREGLASLAARRVSDGSIAELLVALAWALWAVTIIGATGIAMIERLRAHGHVYAGSSVSGSPSGTMCVEQADGVRQGQTSISRRQGHAVTEHIQSMPHREERAAMTPSRSGPTSVSIDPCSHSESAPGPAGGPEPGPGEVPHPSQAPEGAATGAPSDAPSVAPQRASVLALSSLLRVQRRWLHSARLADMALEDGPTAGHPSPPVRAATRAQLPVHLEDGEWTRLILGVVAELVGPVTGTIGARALVLEADAITAHVPENIEAAVPFRTAPSGSAWVIPRDSQVMANVPATPSIVAAARRSALVTASDLAGRRILLDLAGTGTTQLQGPAADLGVKIADVVVELATRRWSDLERLVLVGFGQELHGLEGVRFAGTVRSALEEVDRHLAAAQPTPSIVVIAPHWVAQAGDGGIDELMRVASDTAGVGLLTGVPVDGPDCVWQLAQHPDRDGSLRFGDGQVLALVHTFSDGGHDTHDRSPSGEVGALVTDPGPTTTPQPLLGNARTTTSPAPHDLQQAMVEVRVLGPLHIEGAPTALERKPRLTELITYLALHPGGATSEAFATALWRDRRVPAQTLANRLSEARRALGIARDGAPRLRRNGSRHLLVDVATDWERFRELASEGGGAESWRKALELVRGRPFDGLPRGEWVHLEGFAIAIEAAVVGVACRLGEYSLGRQRPDVAEWCAHQGLLVSPWDERLYRLWMRAADGVGNRGGVDSALRALATALELDGDPLESVHPETVALYRRLTAPTDRR